MHYYEVIADNPIGVNFPRVYIAKQGQMVLSQFLEGFEEQVKEKAYHHDQLVIQNSKPQKTGRWPCVGCC